MDGFSVTFDNENEAEQYIDGFQGTLEERQIEIMRIAGEAFLADARVTKQYKDQTGKLKASTGYLVGLNGEIREMNMIGGVDEGTDAGIELLKSVLAENQDGIVLIGCAGMFYGVYVEQVHGLAVISQSIDVAEKIIDTLNKGLTNENDA